MAERPTGREKKVTGKGKGIKRRGEGLGTGPVGSGQIGDGEQNPKNAVDEEGLELGEDAGKSGGKKGAEGDRDLGDVIQGLNTLSQLTGGGSGNSGGGSGLDALGSLLGGSGSGGSSNSGTGSGLGGLGSLLGQSGNGGNGGYNGNGGNGGYGGNGGNNYNGNSGGSGKKSPILLIIIVAILLLGGGGGLFSGLFGGGSGGSSSGGSGGSSNSGNLTQSTGIDMLQSLLGGGMGSALGSSSASSGSFGGWFGKSNVGKLNTNVDEAAAEKRTVLKGNGKDQVTIMVYMCGTDLESRSSMATADLNEMLQAKTGDNVNIVILTGGCKNWRNNVVSSRVNQIYQLKDGKMVRLEDNYGTNAMTSPDYLAKFIKYCAKNFPANRNELILWDHGGGSISGYGYDEKNVRAGSMDLAEIQSALKAGGVTFDFIGFDACLMATVETGLMLSDYADYMIASEEAEPGVGWYYTNWLGQLEADPSMSTLDVGKNIADDFVAACKRSCPGQATTLSLVDLAELSATAPDKLSKFASDTSKMITATNADSKEDASYKTVATARTKTREFARGTGIDQVDCVHLAQNLGTKASNALADTLLSAVKYNQASANMTNSYGLSIYFPYSQTRNVDAMAKVYKEIGMNSEYTKCIKQFAKMETGGQAAYGGSAAGSPLGSLFSILGGSGSSSGSAAPSSVSPSDVSGLIGSLLGGRSKIDGLSKKNMNYMSEDGLDDKEMASYISENFFDETKLVWKKDGDQNKLTLPEDQWELVTDLTLNMFYDDGEGFIDLGHDNVFEFDDDGALIGENDQTWLAVDEQPVAYYYDSTVSEAGDYTIPGYIPVLLNGERANLIVVFTDEEPDGRIAGATYLYDENVTETVAKNLTELKKGDKIDFIADYYTYKGKYEDSYMIGDQYVVDGEPEISNVEIGEDTWAMYRFTDIFHQNHFTEAIPN